VGPKLSVPARRVRSVIVHQAHRSVLDPTPSTGAGSARAVRCAGVWCGGVLEGVPLQRSGRPRAGVDQLGHAVAESVRLENSRRYRAFTCEARRAGPPPARPDAVAGVVLGVAHLAVLSQPFLAAGRQLEYKTRWLGSCLVMADRWFPSSKCCPDCGVVKVKPPPHVRAFRRGSCGPGTGRDPNTVRNLAALAVSSTTGTGDTGDLEPRGSNGRGAGRGTRTGAGRWRRSVQTAPRPAGWMPHRPQSDTVKSVAICL
jgi:hypothetical protein